MSSEDAAVRGQGLDYLKRCIDFAEGLGSPSVCGPMYSAVGVTQLLDKPARQAQWDRAAGSLRLAAAYANERGIKLAIEPLNRFETDLINTVDQGLRLVDDIAAPNVGLLLDTFHMNIEEKDLPAAIGRARGPHRGISLPARTIGEPRARIISPGRASSRRSRPLTSTARS